MCIHPYVHILLLNHACAHVTITEHYFLHYNYTWAVVIRDYFHYLGVVKASYFLCPGVVTHHGSACQAIFSCQPVAPPHTAPGGPVPFHTGQ